MKHTRLRADLSRLGRSWRVAGPTDNSHDRLPAVPPRPRQGRRARAAVNNSHTRLLAVLTVVAVAATACSGGDSAESAAPATTAAAASTTQAAADASSAPTTSAAATTAPATTAGDEATSTSTTAVPATTTAAAPTTSAATTTTAPAPQWEQIAGTEDCACADGSDFSYWVREDDPSRLVFYLDGGGACFTAESCSFTDGTYSVTTGSEDDPTNVGGIFDFDNPDNPLAGYSFVAVPYCTGDVHLGNTTTSYSEDLTVRHNGFVNASTALAEAVARFGGATEVVVAGSSAGSASAALYGGLAADAFPEASITVVADASGAYPSVPVVNETIGALWGTYSIVPDWPVNEGLTPADWGLVELFIQAGRHAPRIRFARFDNAFDSSQVFYAQLAGFDASRLDELILANEADIEAAGVPVMRYLAPGTDHTILGLDALYTLEVQGVAVRDWLGAVLAGEDVDDVTCEECS